MSNQNRYSISKLSDVSRGSSPPGGKENAAGGLDKCPSICFNINCLDIKVLAAMSRALEAKAKTQVLGYICAFSSQAERSFSMSEFLPVGELLKKLPSTTTLANTSHSLTPSPSREIDRVKGDRKRVQGEGKGFPRTKCQPMYLIARCFQCGGMNWLALDRNNVRPYSKCQKCGEIVPTESFIMVAQDYLPGGKPLYEARMESILSYNVNR